MAVVKEFQSYLEQENGIWPSNGRHILAQFDENSIVVYQAYNKRIADGIVQSQNFHGPEAIQSGFSPTRMTWIKPNFLWMMYRSGWATKPNQQAILAIKLSRIGFEYLLTQSISTRVNNVDTADVRLQWDPDHLPNGQKHPGRRAIQLGIKGETLLKLSQQFIMGVEDISQFVRDQSVYANGNFDKLMVPKERVYQIDNEVLRSQIELDTV